MRSEDLHAHSVYYLDVGVPGWASLIETELRPGLRSAACLRATRHRRGEHLHGTSSLRPNLFLYRNVSVLNLTLIFKGVDQG